MTGSRERSRSPRRDSRRESRSPRRRYGDDDRDKERGRRKQGGFRWKERRREGDDTRQADRGLERGYRERNRERDSDRDRQRASSRDRDDGNRRPRRRSEDRAPRERDGDRNRDNREKDERKPKEKKEKKGKIEKKLTASGEPMIVVNVNDRLGTKAAIPCLASDPIKLFKAQVAARIGREPHEILIKRQGERPFKDQLTLEDYGVSNGVQLDLEVDTGD